MKNHTAASDNTNYITVQDVLYPEYRQVSAPPHEYNDNNNVVTPTVVVVDEDGFRGRNRWDVVWAEATLVTDTTVTGTTSCCNNSNVVVGSTLHPNQDDSPNTGVVVSPPTTSSPSTHAPPHSHGNAMEMIMGLSLAFTAVVGTLAMEISSMIVYIIATVLHECATRMQRNHSLCLGLVFQICALVFILVAHVLMLVDVSLLVCSILLAESLAVAAGILNAILSCGTNGMIWHQYIRRLCHLSRWAFRDIYPSADKKPSRTLPFGPRNVTKEPTLPTN